MRLWLIILLVISVPVLSSEREFKNVNWSADVSGFSASLSWSPSKAINVYFFQAPAVSLKLKINAPYILKETLEARLYLMDSPISSEGDKHLLQSLEGGEMLSGTGRREVVFTNGVEKLINRMEQGAWALIEFRTRSGLVQVIEPPSIDFSHSLEAFNVLRNNLPPMSWASAQNVKVFFTAGSGQLSPLQKQRLDDLLEYLKKDRAVTGMTIDAHTDVSGDRLENLTLSKERAASVKQYLLSKGLDESLLTAVRHHGERYPVSGARPYENRRVEIKLSRVKKPLVQK